MFKSKSLSLSWKRLTERLQDHHHHISIVFAPPPPPPPPPPTQFCCFSTFTRILLFMVSYVLSDKMLPKSYEEAIKQISSGTPTVISFGAFYAGAIFFFFNFQTESILAICTTRIQEMVSMPAYVLKKIQNLTIGFGIYLMRSRCVAAVFEGVRTGRKVRPPKGPHTWGIWGHASSKKF